MSKNVQIVLTVDANSLYQMSNPSQEEMDTVSTLSDDNDGISENEYYDIRFSGHYNSSNHSIQFYYKLAEPLAVTISLYDIMGRKMKYVTSEKLPEANMVMDVQEIRGGLYILNLKLRNGISKSIKIAIE